MNLDDIYTPIDEAKEMIQNRWSDRVLEEKVGAFLNNDIPPFLKDSPKAYLARHLSSLNFEFLRFKELAERINLKFILSECTEDMYLSINSLKHALGKMFFYEGINKNGDKFYVPHKIIDFYKSDGKSIKDVDTIIGKKLVDFHHEILYKEFPEIECNIKDISSWLDRNGCTPSLFYPKFLALFIRNGVLFENFLLNDEEKDLTENVIIPAVVMLKEKFGVKPLIVRLLPKENEDDPSWLYYHESVKKHVYDKNNGNC